MKKIVVRALFVAAFLVACSKDESPDTEVNALLGVNVAELKLREAESFDAKLQNKLAVDAEFSEKFYKYESDYENFVAQNEDSELSGKRNLPLYTIKVVVNNIYRNAPITRERINAQIRRLNDAFAGRLRDRPSGLPRNAERFNAGDTRIRFVLDAVNYRRNQRNFSSNSQLYFRASGGIPPTTPSRRINIYVADLLNSPNFFGPLGDSSFAGDSDQNVDHIFVDQIAFGVRPGIGILNEGKLLVHEMGHYFNLFHLPGLTTQSCKFDDAVGDTPNSSQFYFGDVDTGSSTTSCGSQDMYWNFMNHTNDSEQFMFTNGQRNRMRFTLNPRNGVRGNLTNAR